ncbi:GntR family transcriptional regulator [Nocardia nepalensis]|uniref:GntR family transcriptional regulator n=1 Tax=Nocardia nepalensis TaxID=3375448 RepID=UPI003B66BFF3
MAVQIPDSFPTWLTDLVIGHFPVGDPDAMRLLADRWANTARELTRLLERVEAVAARLAVAIEGEAGNAIQKQFGQITDDIRNQIAFSNGMAKQLYEGANSLELEQYTVIGVAAVLLTMVIIDLMIPGAGPVKAAADRAEAETAMQLARVEDVVRLAGMGGKFAARHPRLMLAAKGIGMGVVAGAVPRLGAYEAQIMQGHRDSVDWKSVGVAAAAGAVGGLVGVGVGHFVAPKVSRLLANPASKAAQVLGVVAASTAGGAAGGIAGGLTAWGLTGGELRGKDLGTMALTGLGAGLVGAVGSSVRAGRAAAYTGEPATGRVHPEVGPSGEIRVPRVTPEPEVTADTGPVREPVAGGDDGQVAKPSDITPEMMADGAEISRRLAGELRPEDYPPGPQRDAVREFLNSQHHPGGDGGNAQHQGSGTPSRGSDPGSSSSGPHSSAPPSGRGNGGSEGLPMRSAPAYGPTEGGRISTVSHVTDGGAGPSRAPGRVAEISATYRDSPPTEQPVMRAEQRGATGDVATDTAAPERGGAESGAARPDSGVADDGGHRSGGDVESPGSHGDSTLPGDRHGSTGPSTPDGDGGGGQFIPADGMGAGLRNCAEEVVSFVKEMTGNEGIDPSLLGEQMTRAEGVPGDVFARALGADWRPGGFESLEAVVEHVQRTGETVGVGMQFKDGAGAHAAGFGKNSLGQVMVRERVVTIEGTMVREMAGNTVREWLVDAQGRRIGAVHETFQENAVAHWVEGLSREVELVGGIEFVGDQPKLRLEPGQEPQARAGIDYPLENLGHRTDTLERGAPSPAESERPLVDLDFESGFADMERGFSDFEAGFARDLARLGVDGPEPVTDPSSSVPDSAASEPPRPALDANSTDAQAGSPKSTPDEAPYAPEANSTATQTSASKAVPEATATESNAGTNSRAEHSSTHATPSEASHTSSDANSTATHANSPTAEATSPHTVPDANTSATHTPEPRPTAEATPPATPDTDANTHAAHASESKPLPPTSDADTPAAHASTSKSAADALPPVSPHSALDANFVGYAASAALPHPAQDSNDTVAQSNPTHEAVALAGPSDGNRTPIGAAGPLGDMSGRPAGGDELPSEPEEFPDRIGTVVTPPMPSYVPAQPQVDEFPDNAPDEYTKPPGTTYKIPGQPDIPDGPPPNAIPIVPHPTTPAVPDTGPAIPLTDRPQVPIPDHAVPGAPAEDDRNGQKPRVHDSEPPLPRHSNNPAPHLPAQPADRPSELTPPARYATAPNPETPGAPVDPTAAPQLNRDSTQYIPDPTVQPTRGGVPATTLAGPLPEPVVAARPVPMAQASAGGPKKRKRKPPPSEPPQPAPEPPAPVPKPTPQPKPRKRPSKGQPPPPPVPEPTDPPIVSPEPAESKRPKPGQSGGHSLSETDRARADLARTLGVDPKVLEKRGSVVQILDQAQVELRFAEEEGQRRALEENRLLSWIARSITREYDAQRANSNQETTTAAERAALASRAQDLSTELLTLLDTADSTSEWRDRASDDPLHELRELATRADAPPEIRQFVEAAARFLGAAPFVAPTAEPTPGVADQVFDRALDAVAKAVDRGVVQLDPDDQRQLAHDITEQTLAIVTDSGATPAMDMGQVLAIADAAAEFLIASARPGQRPQSPDTREERAPDRAESLLEVFPAESSAAELRQVAQSIGWRDTVKMALRQAIRSGRIAEGTRLSSAEEVATQLGLSSSTVELVYQGLSAEGFLRSSRAAGTTVADHRQWPSEPVPDADLPLTAPQLLDKLAAESPTEELARTAQRIGWRETLKTRMRQAIRSGAIPEGTRLPPAKAVADPLGKSPATVGLVYKGLADEGYVVSTNHGTKVADHNQWPNAPVGVPEPTDAPVELTDELAAGVGVAEQTARNAALKNLLGVFNSQISQLGDQAAAQQSATSAPNRPLPDSLQATLTRIDDAGADPVATEEAKQLVLERYRESQRVVEANVYRVSLLKKTVGLRNRGVPEADVERDARAATDAYIQTPAAHRNIDRQAAQNVNQWVDKVEVGAERADSNFVDQLASMYQDEHRMPSEELLDALHSSLAEVEAELAALLERMPHLADEGAAHWQAVYATHRAAVAEPSVESATDDAEPIPGGLNQTRAEGHAQVIRGLLAEIRLAAQFDQVDAVCRLVEVETPSGERLDGEIDVVTDGGRVWREAKTTQPDAQTSLTVAEFERQVGRQLNISHLNREYWVDGARPQIMWHFMNGVSAELKARLESIRIEDESGQIIPDLFVVVIDGTEQSPQAAPPAARPEQVSRRKVLPAAEVDVDEALDRHVRKQRRPSFGGPGYAGLPDGAVVFNRPPGGGTWGDDEEPHTPNSAAEGNPAADPPEGVSHQPEASAEPEVPTPEPWLNHPPDPAAGPIEELLGRTETGREALAGLRAVGASIRYGNYDNSLNAGTTVITIDTVGGALAAASAVVEAAALVTEAEAGRLESQTSWVRDGDRTEYVESLRRAAAAARGRQAEFHRELAAQGYDLPPTSLDNMVVREHESAYLAAYDAAVTQARQQDSDLDGRQLRHIGRAAGVAELLSSELFDGDRDSSGRYWDSLQRTQPPNGLRDYVPASPESARQVDRLVRAHAAAQRILHRIEGDWDRALERLQHQYRMQGRTVPELNPDYSRQTKLKQLQKDELERQQEPPFELTVLADLTAQHSRAHQEFYGVAREISRIVGHDMMDAEVVATGGHWVTDYLAVLGDAIVVLETHADLNTQMRAARNAEPELPNVRTDRVRVYITESGDLFTSYQPASRTEEWPADQRRPDKAALLSDAPWTSTTLAEAAAFALDWVMQTLSTNDIGLETLNILQRHGVRIQFSTERAAHLTWAPGRTIELGTAAGYDAASNTVVLHYGLPRRIQAMELVRAAHLIARRPAAGSPLDRFAMPSDEYIQMMRERHAEAYVRAFEFERLRQSNAEPNPNEANPFWQLYFDAFGRALEVARQTYKNNPQVTAAMHNAAAFQAARRVVYAQFTEFGPRIDGNDFDTFHQAEWLAARGLSLSEAEAPPAPPQRGDTPELREQASFRYVREIESFRMLRDAGRFVPVSPMERAFVDAYAKAEKAGKDDATRRQAGIAAVRKHIDSVGLEKAEIAWDVAQYANDNLHAYRPWPEPVAADAADGHPAVDSASPPELSEEEATELVRHAIDEELRADPGGVRVPDVDGVAEFPRPGARGRLVVAAAPGQHMDTVNDLMLKHPRFTNVLWDGRYDIYYQQVLRLGGLPAFQWISQAVAEGASRHPTEGEAAAEMLREYILYRTRPDLLAEQGLEDLNGLGFGDWLRQLPPECFAGNGRLVPEFVELAARTYAADPNSFEAPHPAEVAYRLMTRQMVLPVPTDTAADPLRTPGSAQFGTASIETPAWIFKVTFESDGDGGWRVPAPNGVGGASDAIARTFRGMTDSDLARLGNRIARMILDGSANLNDPNAPQSWVQRIKRLRKSRPPSEGGSPPGGGRPDPGLPPGSVESYVGGLDPAVFDGHVRTPRRRTSGVLGPDGLNPAVFYYDTPEASANHDTFPENDSATSGSAIREAAATPGDQRPAATGAPAFRRPSDAAVQLFQRILDAERAGDPRAQELRAEAERLIPDDGDRAYAERYMGNARREAALAAELGMEPEQLRVEMTHELQQLFAGDIVTRTNGLALYQILIGGRFKTVFETAGKQAFRHTHLVRRAQLEQELFGYALDLAVELRPVYARVRVARGHWTNEPESATEHGHVDVVFKETVRQRTTACVGDPWGVKGIPSSVDDPQPESFSPTPRGHGELAYFGLEGLGRDYAGPRFTDNSYIEAQIHGGVTASDIEYVVFHRDPPHDALRTALEQAGIPWFMAFHNPDRRAASRRAERLSAQAETTDLIETPTAAPDPAPNVRRGSIPPAAQPASTPQTPARTATNTATASNSTPPESRPLPGRGLPFAIGGGEQRWDGEEEWMKPARQRVPELGVLHNNGGGATRGGRQQPDQADTPTDEAPREFERRYDGSDEAGIKGQVYGDGLLAFEVRRGPSTPGHVMFADMMDSIGGQVRAIAGSWDVTDPIGTSNIDSFNEGIARGLSPEDAARNTFTGKMAVRSGFPGVSIIDAEGPPGQHTSATVLFTKPGDLTDPMQYLRSAFEQTSGQHADTTPDERQTTARTDPAVAAGPNPPTTEAAEPPRDLSALSKEARAALDKAGAELRDLGSADQIAEQLMRAGLPGQTAVVLERIDGVDRARTLVYDGRRVVEVRDPDTDDGMIHEYVPGSGATQQTRALVYSPVEEADRAEAEQALGRLLGRHDSDRFPEHFPDGIPDRPTRAATALDFDPPRTIDGPLAENEWSTLAKLYPKEVSNSRGAPEAARAEAREVWGDRYFPGEPVPAAETPAEYLARQAHLAVATYSNTYRAGANDGIHGWVDQEGVLLFQIFAAQGTPSGQQMFRDLMAEIGSHVRAIRAPWSVDDSFSDNIDTFNAYRQDLGLSPEDAARRTFTGKMAGDMGFTEVTVNHLTGPVGEHLIVDVTFSKPNHSPTPPALRVPNNFGPVDPGFSTPNPADGESASGTMPEAAASGQQSHPAYRSNAAQSTEHTDSPSPYAVPNSVNRLQALRDAVAAEHADAVFDSNNGAPQADTRLARLELTLALLDERLAVERGPNPPIPTARVRLLDHFADAVGDWLHAAARVLAAEAETRQVEPTAAQRVSMGTKAEDRFHEAMRDLMEIKAKLAALSADPPVRADGTGLLDGIDFDVLLMISERIAEELVPAAEAADAADPNSSAMDRALSRYEWLQDNFAALEALIAVMEQPAALIGPERLALLVANFRATASWFAEWHNMLHADGSGRTQTPAVLDLQLAVALQDYAAADRKALDLAAALAAFGPTRPAVSAPPNPIPQQQTWPEPQSEPDQIPQIQTWPEPQPTTSSSAPAASAPSDPPHHQFAAPAPQFRGRPSDEAVELFRRILDAEQTGDPDAQRLRAEAQRLIEDDADRAYAERYVGNARRAAALAAEHGITPEQLALVMTELLRQAFSGEIVVRVKAQTLQKILVSGRFKTLAEVAGKRGMAQIPVEARARLEQELFGSALDKPAELRPVHARIRTTRGDWSVDAFLTVLSEYGDVDVVFESSVAESTTACVGSPLLTQVIPSPITDPQPESFGATPSHHSEFGYFGLEGIHRDYAGESFLRNAIIHAQIHNGAATVPRIAYIVFHRMPPDDQLFRDLEAAGIPWMTSYDDSGQPSRIALAVSRGEYAGTPRNDAAAELESMPPGVAAVHDEPSPPALSPGGPAVPQSPANTPVESKVGRAARPAPSRTQLAPPQPPGRGKAPDPAGALPTTAGHPPDPAEAFDLHPKRARDAAGAPIPMQRGGVGDPWLGFANAPGVGDEAHANHQGAQSLPRTPWSRESTGPTPWSDKRAPAPVSTATEPSPVAEPPAATGLPEATEPPPAAAPGERLRAPFSQPESGDPTPTDPGVEADPEPRQNAAPAGPFVFADGDEPLDGPKKPQRVRKQAPKLGELNAFGNYGWTRGGDQEPEDDDDPDTDAAQQNSAVWSSDAPSGFNYSDLSFDPWPDEAAVAAVHELPAKPGDLDPDLTLDFFPYDSDQLHSEEDVEVVAAAVGDMMRERGWRDPRQIEAAAELVRAAGLSAIDYIVGYSTSSRWGNLPRNIKDLAMHEMMARLTLRMETEADHRSLHVSFEVHQYRPKRDPQKRPLTWHVPLHNHDQIGPQVRAPLAVATDSNVEQWGEVWARFDEPRSLNTDNTPTEPPPAGELEAKARIVRGLYKDHHIRVHGWKAIPVAALESAERALRDGVAEYGGRHGLRDVWFDDTGFDGIAGAFGRTDCYGTATDGHIDHYSSIFVNRELFTDPEAPQRWARLQAEHFYAQSTEDMVYQIVHHEFLHVVAGNSHWVLHDMAPAMLRAAFDLYVSEDLIPADMGFAEWLALLPAYAFKHVVPATGALGPIEGLPEGARAGAVEVSLPLTYPGRVLHWLTVTRDGSSPAPILARWAKMLAAAGPDARNVLLLLQDFRDVTGRDDVTVPAQLRPEDTVADVLEAETGGRLQHFTDIGAVDAELRALGRSLDSQGDRLGDGISALVVEPSDTGDDRAHLLVRRVTEDGGERIELRNPGEGVLRANHVLATGVSQLPGVRAMFFGPAGESQTRPGAADSPAPQSGQADTPRAADGGWVRGGDGQSAPRSEPEPASTEPRYQLADLDDDLPYLPELAENVEWDDVDFDADGVVRDEDDVAYNTGPDGAVFFFTPEGKRTIRYPATHVMVHSSFPEAGHLPYAFGHWYLTDGKRIRITPGSAKLPKSTRHPKFITQCKFEIAKHVNIRTVEFDDDLQGELWRAVRPPGVPTFDQLLDRRGVAALVGEAGAGSMLRGGDVEFWVDVEHWEATTNGLAIALSVGSVFGWSGELTLVLSRENGTKTAHYTDLVPGTDPAQFAATIEKFHTERVASWLAESGVVFDGFGPERESATATSADISSAPAHEVAAPSRSGYQPIAVSTPPTGADTDVDLVWPTVDSRGWFLGPDNQPYYTESTRGTTFLLMANGRFVTSALAWDEDLLATYIAQGGSIADVSGVGTWALNGPLTALEPDLIIVGETNTDPMNPVQILDALLEAGADLTRLRIDDMGGEHQGLLWRGRASYMPVEELVRDRGRDAHLLVAGFGIAQQTGTRGVVFGVELAGLEMTDDTISMRLLITPARCEPVLVTIELPRHGDTFTARYGAVSLGRDQERGVAALAVVHEKLTAWFAASGVTWTEDSSAPPTENLRAEQAHGLREAAATTQGPEHVVRASTYDRWSQETLTEAADWLARQLLGLPSHLVDAACSTLKDAVTEALQRRIGKLHITVETTHELVRITLREATTDHLAGAPEPVATEGNSPHIRSGVEYFRYPVDGWSQASWFELRIPNDTASRTETDDELYRAAAAPPGGGIALAVTTVPQGSDADRVTQVAAEAQTSEVARGRDLLDQLDYREAASEQVDTPVDIDDPIEDPAMAYIARAQGFDTRPTLAGPEEIDAVVAAGWQELFRGVRDSRYADEFRTGRYLPAIPTSSSFGIGIYASSDIDVALGDADDRSEGVIRMALRPDARTIDFADLCAEMAGEKATLDYEERMLTAQEQTTGVRTRRRDLSLRREILSDEGRYAAARGYDAYYVREPGTADVWIILNRSAVVVEYPTPEDPTPETPTSPRPTHPTGAATGDQPPAETTEPETPPVPTDAINDAATAHTESRESGAASPGRGAMPADRSLLEGSVDAGRGDVDVDAAVAPVRGVLPPWAVENRFGSNGIGASDNGSTPWSALKQTVSNKLRTPRTSEAAPAEDLGVDGTNEQEVQTYLPPDPEPTSEERRLAQSALAKLRDFLGRTASVASLTEPVHPDRLVEEKRTRTIRIARWWHALTDDEQDALVAVHPHVIGNTDGVPYSVRDAANRRSIARDLNTFLKRRPDGDHSSLLAVVNGLLHNGFRGRTLSPAETLHLTNLVRTTQNLAAIEQEVRDIGSPPVQLTAFDATAYDGDGRSIVSVGDADKALHATRHLGGVGTTLQKLPIRAKSGVPLYEVATRFEPDIPRAVFIDIGYHHPNTVDEARSSTLAEQGADIVAAEIVGYDATREAWAELPGGAAAPQLRTIVAHSYGSTTLCYAGREGRLADHFDQIVLTGSPGAGPMEHADEFGIGAENVYVLADDSDPVTKAGGDTPEVADRYFGFSHGADPAGPWGADRLRAMTPPTVLNLKQVHGGYCFYSDPENRVPSMSLSNIAAVSAGHSALATRAPHRRAATGSGRLRDLIWWTSNQTQAQDIATFGAVMGADDIDGIDAPSQ